MAAKKIPTRRLAIVNELSKTDILEALSGTFENMILILNVKTAQKIFELSVISFEYEGMTGAKIKFEGINGDGRHYQVNYDFSNHNNCWISEII